MSKIDGFQEPTSQNRWVHRNPGTHADEAPVGDPSNGKVYSRISQPCLPGGKAKSERPVTAVVLSPQSLSYKGIKNSAWVHSNEAIWLWSFLKKKSKANNMVDYDPDLPIIAESFCGCFVNFSKNFLHQFWIHWDLLSENAISFQTYKFSLFH